MTGKGGGFIRHAFHQTAVSDQCIGAVIYDAVGFRVVARGKVTFGDRHTHSVGDSLTERSRGDLDARTDLALGVTCSAASPLTEGLQLVEGQIVSR